MPTPPIRRDAIVACLRENGPMTAHEVADFTGMPYNAVRSCIASARMLRPGEVFCIVAYRPVTGRRARDEFVFAAKAGPDIERPVVDLIKRRIQKQARYRRAHAGSIAARDRARKAKRTGVPVSVNMFAQLAHPRLQGLMSQAASNTSSMAEAA